MSYLNITPTKNIMRNLEANKKIMLLVDVNPGFHMKKSEDQTGRYSFAISCAWVYRRKKCTKNS